LHHSICDCGSCLLIYFTIPYFHVSLGVYKCLFWDLRVHLTFSFRQIVQYSTTANSTFYSISSHHCAKSVAVKCRDAKRVTRRLERTCAVASRRVVNVSVHSTADSVDVAATAATAKVVRYNQRRLYRQLVRRKSAAFWCKKIDADRADPQGLWRSVDKLLGRDRTTASEIIDGDTFNRYFIDKVSKVRLSTSGATPPTYSHSRSGVSFTAFLLVNVDTVIDAVQQLPDKSSAADPMPTLVLKQVVDLVAPFLTELFNRLMAAGHFPSGFKQAFITPIV
jgi:hypothetical protein